MERGDLVQRALAIGDHPDTEPGSELAGALHGASLREKELSGKGRGARTVEVKLPISLCVNESYVISVVQEEGALGHSNLLKPTSLPITVLAGDEPMYVQLHAERITADVKIKWSALNLAPRHWSNSLALPQQSARKRPIRRHIHNAGR